MAMPKQTITHADGTVEEVNKPLELDVDPNEITVDESCLFESNGFSIVGFRAFLAKYSNWTLAEIGALKITELDTVLSAMSQKLEDKAVPKTSSPSSNGSLEATQTTFPAG